MPRITIDQRDVEVPQGATILDAARKLGVDVPTLCFLEGRPPSTSCLACMVKVRLPSLDSRLSTLDSSRLVPACATEAVDGMAVESETDEVHAVRRSALELLLSEHVGDCLAPCWFGCPAHMDIPKMLRQITSGELREAIATVKQDIALPAVLGRICPKPCEKVCRRGEADGAVAICQLKRYAADVDLASDDPYMPECEAATGRRVAIIGGGPTGLAAAYTLRRRGHAVAVFDLAPQLGGRLRHETTEAELPREVLDAEIAQIVRLGVDLHLNTPVSAFSDQLSAFRVDAILIACGAVDDEEVANLDARLKSAGRGIEIETGTYRTRLDGVFAAGSAVRGRAMVVRSVADGKEAAEAIDRYLRGQEELAEPRPFNSRIGKLTADEIRGLGMGDGGLKDNEDRAQVPRLNTGDDRWLAAARCLHCDCRALADCKLRHYAALYGADPRRFDDVPRAAFEQDRRHAEVVYEPGKCIRCGLCVEIARQAGEPLGLTFIGRGFDVRVGVPFDRSMAEALAKAAADCIAACPTGALAKKDG